MRAETVKRESAQPMSNNKGKSGVEQELIRELAKLLDETGLSEIEIDRDGLRVRVARKLRGQGGGGAAAHSAAPVVAEVKPIVDDPVAHPGCVRSPMVGTAYLAPEPGSANFVDIGSRVVQGQTILIIEAMKTMNHIPAPKAGTVTRILVGNRQPVEFGEPLAIIE
jgi:acetyl-CoA carboxylase biotin carboxyl carrier protein